MFVHHDERLLTRIVVILVLSFQQVQRFPKGIDPRRSPRRAFPRGSVDINEDQSVVLRRFLHGCRDEFCVDLDGKTVEERSQIVEPYPVSTLRFDPEFLPGCGACGNALTMF
jgi:hypothetical protein